MFRIAPNLPVTAYKTYALHAPRATHRRAAACAEVDCPPHQHGWATTVTAGSDDEVLLLRAAGGGVDGRRRALVKHREPGGFVRYVFPAGQACFRASAHSVPLEREPLYVVRGGDWRGNPTRQRFQHRTGVDWVEDFGEHQERIKSQIEKG